MSFPDSIPARMATPLGFVALLFSGAIFGFFYAWTVSTMWGLDAADPRVAIEAMQAMNASVRNAAFAPVFFGTPFVLLFTASAAMAADRRAAWLFGVAAVVYFVGALMLTVTVNVPLNEALAATAVPIERAQAALVWSEYSGRWQLFNEIRMALSGVSLLLTGLGLWRLGRTRRHHMLSAARAGHAMS
ncbi:DUF1772 domain-containing protein [Pararhodobacter sp. CCB-MM2]|uniref:anthrone oxygenase family protein n=1 Tax=Pararhodobacter sp. CCB-MM2 TaxID=1786003 RepID=UPI0008297D2F|nr:anthrone oxygenase family protein [Pararhodobacter sp. CCB-MM2]